MAERSAAAFAPSPLDVVCDPNDALASLADFPVSGSTFGSLLMVDEARLDDA